MQQFGQAIMQQLFDALSKQGVTASNALLLYLAWTYIPPAVTNHMKFVETLQAQYQEQAKAMQEQNANMNKLVDLHKQSTDAITRVADDMKRVVSPPDVPLPNRASTVPLPSKQGSE